MVKEKTRLQKATDEIYKNSIDKNKTVGLLIEYVKALLDDILL